MYFLVKSGFNEGIWTLSTFGSSQRHCFVSYYICVHPAGPGSEAELQPLCWDKRPDCRQCIRRSLQVTHGSPPPPPLPFPPITSVPLSRWTRGLSSGAFRGCQLSVTRQTWHSLPWTFFFLRNPFQRQPLSQTSLSPRLTVGSPPQADWTSPGASPCPCRVRGLLAGRSARATARASEPGNPESARGCTTVPRIPPRCFSRGAGCRWKKNEDLNSAQFFLSFMSADVCILRQEIRLVSEMHPV